VRKPAVVSQLLGVLDDLERARSHGGPRFGPAEVGCRQAVRRTDRPRVWWAFGAEGDDFDPALHEAVQHEGDGAEGSKPVIGNVMRQGYKLGEQGAAARAGRRGRHGRGYLADRRQQAITTRTRVSSTQNQNRRSNNERFDQDMTSQERWEGVDAVWLNASGSRRTSIRKLGVSSEASQDEIQAGVARKLARRKTILTATPDNAAAEERYKAVSEAKEVLTDPAKRKEYDETRRLFAGGGFGRRFNGGGGGDFTGGFGVGGDGAEFNLNDLFDAAGRSGGQNNIGDLFGGLFGRGAQPRPQPAASRQRPGDRDRARLHGGHQGRGDAAAADQPGARAPTVHGSGARARAPARRSARRVTVRA